MRVDYISDPALTIAEMGAALASCWPDLEVAAEDIEPLGSSGEAWRTSVPAPLAARIVAGEQGRWQNSATIPVDGEPVTVVLTFDPATAQD